MGNIHVVGPNKALLISSGQREARVVVGGRAFVPWLLKRCDSLSLELRTIIIESKKSATVQGVMVSVTGVCQVKISGFKEVEDEDGNKRLEKDVHAILLAGQHFIGQSNEDIEHAVASTLEGHQRSILGTLTVEELSKDRATFSARVRELAKEDLRSMGMELVSYTIASLTDDQGYLASLGVTQTSKVKKVAQLGECTNMNEAVSFQAEEELKSQVKVNEAKKKIEKSVRDVKVTQAKLREEINIANAQADAAKLLEEAKLQQTVVEEEAKQAVVRAKVEVDVEMERVRRRRLELEATVHAQAEADLFKKIKEAEGLRQYAEAEAHRVRIVGEAEADALRKREMVEVDMLKLKAEAYKEFGQAALAVQMIEAMPEVAKAIASPLSKTEKIVFMGGGEGGSGPSAMISEVAKSAELVNETLQSMTGVTLTDMLSGEARLPGLAEVTTPLALATLATPPRQASMPIKQ